MAFTASETTVSQLFQSSFGRPVSSQEGLTAWVERYDAKVTAGSSSAEAEQATLAEMNISDESTAIYNAKDEAATVDFIFTNSLGRTAVEPGRTAWVERAATIPLEQLQQEILASARVNDDFNYMNDLIDEADAELNPIVEVVGNTFYLTAGTDRSGFVGTADNDQFNAYIEQNSFAGGVSNSLSSADVLDGGAGTDSLYAEIVPEFFGATGDNQIDIQPRTSNIENVTFEARDASNAHGAIIVVDAKNMTDIDEIGSYMSDGDLIIENLTTAQSSGDDRNTDELTITMDHTDNFNSDGDASDLTVYFDEDYLLVGQSTTVSQANYWLLDENTLDYTNTPLEIIERNGVSLTIDGVAFDIQMEDSVAAAADTWVDFAAGLQDVINAEVAAGNTDLANLTVAVDVNNTDSTFNDAGVEVTIPAITITDSIGRVLVPTGFTSPAELTAGFDIYGKFDNVASTTIDNDLAINVELNKVGREGEGGDLLIGGKELDQDGGAEAQGNGIGIFNIDVLGDESKLSNLGSINSTNNALTTVNIATEASYVSGDTFASLTVRDAFDASTAVETVNANAFLGDLNIGQDDAALNVNTFTATGGGDVTYNAEIDGTEKSVFTNTTAAGDDTLTVMLDGDAVDTVGTSFAINAGHGANTVTVAMTTDMVSVATTALLDNLSINTGSGEDEITLVGGSALAAATDGDADFNITSGGASDFVYINSISDAASVVAATGTWTVGDLDGTGATTFVDRVLYQATIKVNFAGFEKTVTVDTNAAGNFVATQLDINNAIKDAIASNVELSKLLTVTETTGSQQMIITSTVEGNNDLAISLFQNDLVEVAAVGSTTFNASDLTAVAAGIMETTANNSDTVTTVAAVVAILNGLDGFLEETGVVGSAYDLLETIDGADGVDETSVTNVSTIDMGTGANDLVVLNSDDDSANTLLFSADWGKVSVLNFFTDAALAQTNSAALADDLVEGLHTIDFTEWLDDQVDPSATANILSATRTATTDVVQAAGADLDLDSNEVVIVNDWTSATGETWSGMTATNIDAALTDAGAAGADDYGTNAIVGSSATAIGATLIGATQDSILMIENDLNAGEYKVFNVETTAAGATEAFDVTLVGVIDFGGEIDATTVFA